jgi:hypothetical protein
MAASASRRKTLAVREIIERGDVDGLDGRLAVLLGDDRGACLDCDLAGARADVVTIEALARLQLAALRRGGRLRLRNASAELCQLIAFLGLAEVLPGAQPDAALRPPAGLAARTAGRASQSRGRT